ncbi:hypothetical protein BU25DRAFT_475785 [Macroventuria anomochaeta]|uniref:Uncharacterized protein n=1 Tax=Macroventuria anomochaeta TaxID=301207 RepID=A0ACB6SG56_9PLEO|nr:uncharacterized protein BU25DRAFT_475785 [Macroventuria anomochaeta]KAF2632318.1 hypothetical protein BU25DRAFT_475785 [Macroventuria anomochaeta]
MMQFYAFDVIGEITVGSQFGLMEDSGDKSGIIEAIDESLEYGAIIGLVLEWHRWIGMTADKLGLEPNIRSKLNFVNHRLDNRVSGRTKSSEDRSDFLDKMLPMEQEGKATRFHTQQVAPQIIAAGSDMTVIAYLAMYPNTLVVLRHELD